MTSKEIRSQFLEFFKEKGHRIVPSAPVVPFEDPTLLFTNAGMNQFKDVFLGAGRREYKRAADTQKCIRVSGKHNDLEEVGHDTYHHTFFEMLGNWSFGDYYKKEAIGWAWELLTDVWKLPKERLWATVYQTDDEAFEFWKSETDINPDHILRFGEKDNFWEMGDTGPCGPCSEIHISIGEDYDNPELVNAGSPKCIEIWNLVFIQYNRDDKGTLHELPSKHVDTGMGFERVCAVLQKKDSNYDTDVFKPLIDEIEKISGVKYLKEKDQIPMRVIADHIRTLTFAIADGAMPGNEGRGYVLRRILRRASRYGRKLDLKEPFLHNLVDTLVVHMSDIFPEISEQKDKIKRIIRGEEESFNVTLDRGIELFEHIIDNPEVKKSRIIGGDEVFKLYDTYGFPMDLTNIMAAEKGMKIDENRFNELMDEQKERARRSAKDKMAGINTLRGLSEISDIESTEFLGYDTLGSEASILKVIDDFIVLDRTPFYAESGGQIGDTGYIIGKEFSVRITDTQKLDKVVLHKYEGEIDDITGSGIRAEVDEKRRWDIMRNHSATHFLHAALREVLGQHIQQAGSFVGPDRLRFDFTHFEKLSNGEIAAIESVVNEKLLENLPMFHHKDTPFEEAKKMGALMFFGDKYGDKVNVVQFGDFTMEFCGGTHVGNSSQIGLFKILSESSIASGVRRIEAVTGHGVEKYIQLQEEKLKKTDERLTELLDEKKRLEKEITQLQLQDKLRIVDAISGTPIAVKDVTIFKGKVDAANMDELKQMGDHMLGRIKSGVGILFADFGEKAGIVAVVTDDLIKGKGLLAGKIVGDTAKMLGGGGGGRPHLATAGGKDPSKIDEVIENAESIVAKYL